MVLGNAWNSPLMLEAIEKLVPEDIQIALFTHLRVHELTSKASHDSYGLAVHGVLIQGHHGGEFTKEAELLTKLRQNAIDFQENRKKYVLNQLALGGHPDITPGFWSALKDVPEIDKKRYKEGIPRQQEMRSQLNKLYLFIGSILIGVIALGFGIRTAVRRRRAVR